MADARRQGLLSAESLLVVNRTVTGDNTDVTFQIPPARRPARSTGPLPAHGRQTVRQWRSPEAIRLRRRGRRPGFPPAGPPASPAPAPATVAGGRRPRPARYRHSFLNTATGRRSATASCRPGPG